MGTKVGHCKADNTDQYVGRGPNGRDMTNTPVGERGWLGNPYSLDSHSREESVEKFARDFCERLQADSNFAEAVASLKGDVLGCWCQGVDESEPACHAEVIAEAADILGGHGGLEGTEIPEEMRKVREREREEWSSGFNSE